MTEVMNSLPDSANSHVIQAAAMNTLVRNVLQLYLVRKNEHKKIKTDMSGYARYVNLEQM